MSATGNSVQTVWVIREHPHDDASLFRIAVSGREYGSLVFTQPEYAKEFARDYPDIPSGAVVAPLAVSDLPAALAVQAERGCTHVITDPILGSPSYMDAHTLTIDQYLRAVHT